MRALPSSALLCALMIGGCSETGLTVQPPTSAPAVHIAPDEPYTVDELRAVVRNPDSNFTYTYRWSRDGQVVAEHTAETVPASATTKHEQWSVEVTPWLGDLDGPAATDQVGILNSRPEIAALWVDPAPTTRSDLALMIDTSDADDDEVTLSFAWQVDGQDASFDGPLVPADATARGQIWQVTITPNDGDEDGPPAVLTIEIGNSPPGLDALLLSPIPAFTDTPILATPDGLIDADGDAITLSFDWYIDGDLVASGPVDELPSDRFVKHQIVRAVVTPSDGLDPGEPVTSEDLPILNSPPFPPTLEFVPAAPEEGDALTCRIAVESYDADLDPVTYTFSWEVDGDPYTGATDEPLSSTVPADVILPGETWTCRAVPFDGEDEGPPAEITTSAGTHCADDPSPWTVGLGTADSPYRVAVRDELDAIRDAHHCYFELTDDVALGGEDWTPIPELTGQIDGAGYAILDLTMDAPTVDRRALIDKLEGRVLDLELRDVFIRGKAVFGALVAETIEDSDALVSGVRVSGEIQGVRSFGGVVGVVRPGTRVERLRFSGTIKNDARHDDGFMGGVLSSLSGEAYDLVFDGTIEVSSTAWKVGGIVSQQSGSLERCSTHGTIDSNGSRVAGVTATVTARASIRDCYVDASLRGTDITAGLIGEGWRVTAVSLDDSYVSGRISGGTSSFPARAIVGTSASGITVRRTFWDTDTTGQSVAGVSGATGHRTWEMQTAATFSGWSSPPWKIEDGAYPVHED